MGFLNIFLVVFLLFIDHVHSVPVFAVKSGQVSGMGGLGNSLLNSASVDLAQKLVSCQDKPELHEIITTAKKNFNNDYKKILSYIVENAPGTNKLIMTVGGNPRKNGKMTLVGEGNVNNFRLSVLTLMHGCYVTDEENGEVIGIVTVQ